MIAFVAAGAHADGRAGWWAALDLGVAGLEYETPATAQDESTFMLALRAGYQFDNRVRLGIETNGFGIESGNLQDTSKGKGISQIAVITLELHPRRGSDWFMKAGLGWSSYWENATRTKRTDSGAWQLGLGHEIAATKNLRVSPFVDYHRGRVSDLRYRALSIGVSLRWHRYE